MAHPYSASAAQLRDALDLSDETVQQYAADALTRPSDASFWDEDLYVTHTLAFHTPDWSLTSDYIDGQANYRDALEDLTARYPRQAEAASVGHWTYSRFQCVKVQVLTKRGNLTPAFVYAVSLIERLRDYPLLSDETYWELEEEVWDAAIKDAVEWAERDREEPFTEGQRAEITQYLFEHVAYQHETGYIPDDDMASAVEYALRPDSERQPHQDAALF